MKKILKFVLPLALLAIVVSGVVTGVALAQGGGSSGSGSGTKVDQFLGFLATRLGISSDQLKTDVQGAASDTVNQMLKDGTITQQQADKLNQEIQNGNYPGLLGRFGGFGGCGKGDFGTSFQSIVQSVADTLKLTPQQIQDQLKSGKSLADIAGAQGVSRDDLKSAITTAVDQQVDKAVTDGKITQTRADQIKTNLSNNLDKIIDQKRDTSGTPENNGNGQNGNSPMWRGGMQRGRSGLGMSFM